MFAGVHRGEGPFPVHIHPDTWEIVYLWEGRLSERVEDRLIEMQPGMFIVHPPGARHGDVSDTNYVLYHAQFKCPEDPQWPLIAIDDSIHSIGATLQAIVEEWYNSEPDREEMLHLLGTRMHILLRRSSWHALVSESEAVVAKAEGILRQRCGGPIRVEEVAEAVGVSRSTLYNCFKEVRGMTPMEVLNRLRIKHALFLLRHTHMPVGKIAEAAGYCSASHLTRRLKEATGFNPRNIRAAGSRRSLRNPPEELN